MTHGEKEPILQKPTDLASEPHQANGGYGSTSVVMPEEGLAVQGSVVSFHRIGYTVQVSKGCCGGSADKHILKDVSGIFKPGMNAILGPTGSGKSSLLDVLAGRKEKKGLSGLLLVDGHPQPENFKCMSGYVVQDDVVMGTLTVKENFQFSAALRLPKTVTKEERKARVERVIHDLGLTHCADTKIGNEFIRGVSGGERKRTNIGMELIIQPTVLFLDEPTTGLDASTANSVMLLLKRLAHMGNTIIFSVHQPRYSIFRLFDSIMLLSQGESVFHGPCKEALQYFSSIGYECEEHNNPPDFFLDVINGDSTAVTSIDQLSKHLMDEETMELLDSNREDHSHAKIHPSDGESRDVSEVLAAKFRESDWHKNLFQELTPIEQTYMSNVAAGQVIYREVGYATSFPTQLWNVSKRTVKNIIGNPQANLLQFVVNIFLGVIVGAIYWQIDTSLKSGIQNRVGAFFFIVMNMVFSNLSAIELFLKERSIFMHENASGFYRVSAYFLAKVFCDLIPRTTPVLLFSAISYWMIGLQADAGKFFFFTLNLVLTTLTASAYAFFVSASVRIIAIANLLIAMTYVFMMIFSGLLVNLDSIGDWLKWIKWLSLFRYSIDALTVNEMKDLNFCDTNNGTQTCQAGTVYLDSQGITYATAWDLWYNEMALGIMTVVFMFLAYIQLRRVPKLK
ncbi:ATP-binding cassette sub-family G member 2 [Lingula anatina]|uniref:ATP-binding cassette sub-family G member 2 n=1 Tax=Lingula anatina TaxID=7574 RepID=A0A1S3IGR0_LINAN|nr:ATP-binding cassette sub-family G member 2 [Lingula anatina]|eukprot:XP_013397450.1 ATP-binding cassette sub-family G member 2 [Lingula anatina]